MKKTLLVSLLILAFSSSQAAELCGPQTDSFAFVIDRLPLSLMHRAP